MSRELMLTLIADRLREHGTNPYPFTAAVDVLDALDWLGWTVLTGDCEDDCQQECRHPEVCP